MKVLSTFSGIGCGAGPFDEGSKCIGVADVEIKSLNGEVLRIDDLLDFSNEEISGPIWKESSQAVQKCADISPLCTQTINIHSPAKAKSHSLPVIIDTDTQFADIGVPYDDVAELEWLSNFVEESFSLDQDYKFLGTLEVKNIAGNADQSSRNIQLQTSSSICVVEDNANSDDKRCVRGVLSPPARARRKRTRSGVRTPSVLDTVSAASESSTSSDSPCLSYTSAPANEKTCINHSFSNKFFKYARKRRKMSLHSIKCMHCGIQKTPQWRAGPLGPKTLCNACGVRYKSGRLLPEYRPAASPQYIPEKHSNSHKRVLEMRLQKELRIPHRKQDY